MIDVIPALLPESFEDLKAHAARVRGLVARVQIDVANGSYAPSKTWPYSSNEHFKELVSQEEGLPFWEDMEYEIDMLIEKPEEAAGDWIAAGASALIFHIETLEGELYSNVLKNIGIENIEIGLALKPSTPVEELERYIEHVDFVQCMGNDRIGFGGVALDERVYEKVRDIKKRWPGLPLAVDIGVNEDTAPRLVEAGATKLVSGSAIFGNRDVGPAIRYFQSR